MGALFAAVVTIGVLFSGSYLPYTDWPNHVGLIAVLSRGEENGALDFLQVSLEPTPYLSFYALSALLGRWIPADAAAKIVLATAGPLLVLAAASLLEATGRSPRAALIAPLAFFGVSLGFGFGSFVFASPLSLFALSSAERVLTEGGRSRRHVVGLATWLSLLFLGHGILFVATCALIALRAVVGGVTMLARGPGSLAGTFPRGIWALFLGGVPALVLSLPIAIRELWDPWREAGTPKDALRLFEFSSFEERLASWGGHLLDRGDPGHTLVMIGVAVWVGALLTRSIVRAHSRDDPGESRNGLEIFAAGLSALYLFGPVTFGPIWYVYPRFGVLAALLLCLLPRADLRGPVGASLALSALLLVGWNARLNADGVRRFSSLATKYDAVRAAIPPRARVLALTVVGKDDFAQLHGALSSLYFYHLVDGASYVAFLFDHRLSPVRYRTDVPLPRAPFWRAPSSYNPRTHGKDFDYLVLRGPELVRRTDEAGEHDRVADINGWIVYRTRDPAPRPGG